MVGILIFSIALVISFVLSIYNLIEDADDMGKLGCSWFLTGCLFMAVWWSVFTYCKPSAMDVYQDKTELQYTVKGDVPIDSTVVYKDKK